jgi:hypothetical protein
LDSNIASLFSGGKMAKRPNALPFTKLRSMWLNMLVRIKTVVERLCVLLFLLITLSTELHPMPNSDLVAIACENIIQLHKISNGQLVDTIPFAHKGTNISTFALISEVGLHYFSQVASRACNSLRMAGFCRQAARTRPLDCGI